MTQRERLLAWARHGRRIRQIDWVAAPPDGLEPIMRVAAVIGALEGQGYSFDHVDMPNGTTEYLLLQPARQAAPASPAERLLDIEATPASTEAIYR